MNPRTTIALIAALVLAVIGVWWAQSSADKGAGPEKPSGPQALFEPALGELTGFELSLVIATAVPKPSSFIAIELSLNIDSGA